MRLCARKPRRCGHCNGTGRVGYTDVSTEVLARGSDQVVAHTSHRGTVTCLYCNGEGTER
ncbi:hypothetical protein [Couchioplanes caeruleus]|uniref:Uncharacterized protein n=1 Tax=Couchioplanes caeruleus subsp. caeruleus TaxID=56427 RepID=A0A1K0GKR9_9ACTN|nr:hypothetical protein [Couchioplanes caeruleus]OJF09787.1 hypothetical protein BG844_35535 [Couchioplanes caeruleus subsp. caeruleus]